MAINFPDSPTNGQTYAVGSLTWQYDGQKWVAANSIALDGLSDVTAPTPTSGDFLKWNGTAWVNDPINLGTDTTGNSDNVTEGTTNLYFTDGRARSALLADNAGTASGIRFIAPNTGTVELISQEATRFVRVTSNAASGGGKTEIQGSAEILASSSISDPGNLTVAGSVFVGGGVVFEGATANNHETSLVVTDPTADRTITLPNADGTVALTSDISTAAGAITINDLFDVTAPTPTSGDLLKWNGTAWVNGVVSSIDNIGDVTITQSYAIGDTGPAGGKIFITPSTAGNSTGKYFEAAPFLNPDVTRTWATDVNSNRTTAVSGADGLLIGTGAQNTIDIVAQSGNVAATCAAAYASDYTYGGFSDWFLPSRDEILQLYVQKNSIGGFSTGYYWASSEIGGTATDAYSSDFNTNDPELAENSDNKQSTRYVRPVRSFTTASPLTSGDVLKWNGTAWVNGVVSSIDNIGDVTLTTTYAIGATGPAGGKIFITPSTEGNSTGKYFEASPFLNPDLTRTWATNVNSNQTTAVSGADGTAIGTGAQNTIDIVAQSGNVAATCAAAYASDYTYGGFSDWFLPSRDELAELGTNRGYIGGFSGDAYWSSSETAADTARRVFLTGYQDNTVKTNSHYVRPVRSFTEAGSSATSGDVLKWNGNAWFNASGMNSGLVPIVPTAVVVGSGSATTSANGLVTFTGATDVSLDGIFSSAYRNYRVVWTCDPNASNGNLLCRVRVGGVSQTDTIYSYAAWRMSSESTYQPDQCGTGIGYFLIGDLNASADGAGTIDIFNPFALKRTAMTSLYTSGRTDNKSYIVMASAQVNNLLSYDGIFMRPGGASNGTVAVYGYKI